MRNQSVGSESTNPHSTPPSKEVLLKLGEGSHTSAITNNLVSIGFGEDEILLCANGNNVQMVGLSEGKRVSKKECLRHRIYGLRSIDLSGVPVVAFATTGGFELCAPMQFVGASMCFKTFGANCSENNRVYALAMLGFASFDAQVWESSMKACRFSKQLQGRQVDAKEGLYFQALTSLVCENGACILCVGGSDGCVHMYSPEDDLVFVQAQVIENEGVPVIALEGLSRCHTRPFRLLVSSGNHGVHVYDVQSSTSYSFSETIPARDPVVAMSHNCDHVVLGFYDGRIWLLSQDLLQTTVEIIAHSRFLSTLQMHTVHPWLLSAAQDGTAAVWKLPDKDSNEVGVTASVLWNNHLITGGAFGCGEGSFVLSAYGSTCLRVCSIG